MYRFYINVVEDGVAYGCLTYYDSVSKVILRKNFKISSDDIDYDYVPKDEWVKGNTNCKKAVFGNGCNYVAQIASDNASNALDAYKAAVALYEKNAALDEEVKNINVENAKLEYVKAEVEAWRMQQVLELIKNTINNNDVKDDDYENIETVINNIAGNLDVAPEIVERMVAQIIIDTDNSEDVVTKAKELTAEDAINTLDTTQEIVEIEDEEVPLDSSNEVVGTNRNFWLPLLIALACVTVIIYIVGKRKSEKELG